MASQESASLAAPPPANHFAPGAAFLSYLIPGLGQIVQGRVGKGILFLVCLYSLFFYGMYLGNWRNVYIAADPPETKQRWSRDWFFDSLLNRVRFAGQFWIGAVAWPAIIQYDPLAPTVRQPYTGKIVRQKKSEEGQLVEVEPQDHPWFGKFMREPDEDDVNRLMRDSDKTPELGWMYTVIAGVLNILVIYDALAGPAYAATVRPSRPQEPSPSEAPRDDVAPG